MIKRLLIFASILLGLHVTAQQTITNTFVLSNDITVITTVGDNLVPVVTSAGVAYTNIPPWVPTYVNSQIYTNGVTTNNLKSVFVLWGEPRVHPRGIYQGKVPVWNGRYYVSLNLAKERVMPGDNLHVLLFGSDTNLTVTMPDGSTSVSQWMAYRIISIPLTQP